jgi:hypothetical protein
MTALSNMLSCDFPRDTTARLLTSLTHAHLADLPLLPPQGGVLPLWMGFVSFLAFFNTAQNLLSTKLTKQVYSRRPMEGGLLCHAMLVFGEAGKGSP